MSSITTSILCRVSGDQSLGLAPGPTPNPSPRPSPGLSPWPGKSYKLVNVDNTNQNMSQTVATPRKFLESPEQTLVGRLLPGANAVSVSLEEEKGKGLIYGTRQAERVLQIIPKTSRARDTFTVVFILTFLL